MVRTLPLIGPATLLVVAVLVAACGGGGATPAPTTVTIKGSEYAFDPSTIQAAANGVTIVRLQNTGIVEHDFTVDALNVKALAKVGETAEARLANPRAGSYEFYCSIPGHREAGMKGTLEVK